MNTPKVSSNASRSGSCARFALAAAIAAGNVNVGIMSFGTLTFGAGATNAKATAGAGGAVLDITASNGLVLNGTTTLNVGGVNLTVGIDYPLVDTSGSSAGAASQASRWARCPRVSSAIS